MSACGTFRTCLISELSLLSGVKRKLDLETPKGSFWGKAAVREMANYGAYMRGLNDRREK